MGITGTVLPSSNPRIHLGMSLLATKAVKNCLLSFVEKVEIVMLLFAVCHIEPGPEECHDQTIGSVVEVPQEAYLK